MVLKFDIYSITCKSTGVKYIGRSQEIEKRWRAHKNMLRRGMHNNTLFQNDWTLYGEEDFSFEILHTFDNKADAEFKEQEYIDNDFIEKYNISDAKDGGDTFRKNPRKEEIRKLKSINSSGERNPMYGVPKSEYSIQRTKEANSKPIIIDGVRYNSTNDASKELGIGSTTINYRLNATSEQFSKWIYA